MSAAHLRIIATSLSRDAFAAGPGSAKMQEYLAAAHAAEAAEVAEKQNRWADGPTQKPAGIVVMVAQPPSPSKLPIKQSRPVELKKKTLVEYVARRVMDALKAGKSASSVRQQGFGKETVTNAVLHLESRGLVERVGKSWRLKEGKGHGC